MGEYTSEHWGIEYDGKTYNPVGYRVFGILIKIKPISEEGIDKTLCDIEIEHPYENQNRLLKTVLSINDRTFTFKFPAIVHPKYLEKKVFYSTKEEKYGILSMKKTEIHNALGTGEPIYENPSPFDIRFWKLMCPEPQVPPMISIWSNKKTIRKDYNENVKQHQRLCERLKENPLI